jgi:hypothetical protein
VGLRNVWRKVTYRTEDNTDYRALEERAGQMTPWYDNRAVPDALPSEQPQPGFAESHLRMVDPSWRPR